LLAVLLAAALAVTACAGGDGTEQPAGASAPGQVLERQTVSSDDVEIAVSGRLTSSSAVFDVELTRHDGDLTNDVTASTVSLGPDRLSGPVWAGDPATGHHRVGSLSFTYAGSGAVGASDGAPVVLTLSGWPDPVELRWDGQGAAQLVPSSG
jgi:hypothetical protein